MIAIVPHLSANKGDDELSQKNMTESDSAGVQTTVYGFSVPIHRQPTTEAKQRINPYTPTSISTKTSKPGKPEGINKIRNYNVKD